MKIILITIIKVVENICNSTLSCNENSNLNNNYCCQHKMGLFNFAQQVNLK